MSNKAKQTTKQANKPKQPSNAKKAYRRYAAAFRQQAVARMAVSESVSALADELGIPRTHLYRWQQASRSRAAQPGSKRESPERSAPQLEAKLAAAEAALGRQSLELDFFVSALRRVEASRSKSGVSGASASTPNCASGCSRKAD